MAKEFDLKFTTNGNDRRIAGASSGSIAAFNVAWEGSDAFSCVYANSGRKASSESLAATTRRSIHPFLQVNVKPCSPQVWRVGSIACKNPMAIAKTSRG
jgi:S-formylglutathione hydrolase FrmB